MSIKIKLILVLLSLTSLVKAQAPIENTFVKDMQWNADYRIHMTLFNDSSYDINVSDMIHSKASSQDSTGQNFVYFPVMLARDFVGKFKDSTINSDKTISNTNTDTITQHVMTLWSALHASVGGGWVHFFNCMLYALDTRYLSLTAPLMERPHSTWKPKPITETYLRTKKWKFYVPVDQKEAQKEYFIKKKENQLFGLHDVPMDFVQLFLETNNRKYKKIKSSNQHDKQARIDLVKLLLGSNYLGTIQISYIKTMVLKAMVKYSYNQLPNVIVFDDLQAAVVMSLNESGYNIEKIVFRNANSLEPEEKQVRIQKIESTIKAINKVNQKIFEERLKKYYN